LNKGEQMNKGLKKIKKLMPPILLITAIVLALFWIIRPIARPVAEMEMPIFAHEHPQETVFVIEYPIPDFPAYHERYALADELLARLGEMADRLDEMNSELAGIIEQMEAPEIQEAEPRIFYSFMGWQAITYRNSRQWEMQQSAETCGLGLRRYNGLPMVATGTGWGFAVGDEVIINFTCGQTLDAVIGDIKSDIHTCENNKRTLKNGCYLEFITDVAELPEMVRQMGNMAYAVGIAGRVQDVKVGDGR
jgi:hypothetical protein